MNTYVFELRPNVVPCGALVLPVTIIIAIGTQVCRWQIEFVCEEWVWAHSSSDYSTALCTSNRVDILKMLHSTHKCEMVHHQITCNTHMLVSRHPCVICSSEFPNNAVALDVHQFSDPTIYCSFCGTVVWVCCLLADIVIVSAMTYTTQHNTAVKLFIHFESAAAEPMLSLE